MDGILLINKPTGWTSHDVVAKLRQLLHIKRIGHSGTLDPQATGALLVFIGKACKVLPFIQDTDKEYIAQLQLGKQTQSDDIYGETLAIKPIQPISNFEALLASFLGKQKQLPPLISSIKIKGKKLYEYARAKEEIDIPLRDIEIFDIVCLNAAQLKFKVHCSSGTYIRALCRDIALKSGNLGCMSSLIRSKIGRFSLDDCVSIDDVANGKYQLLPIRDVLTHYPFYHYEALADVYHGKKIRLHSEDDQILIVDDLEAIALYKRDHDDIYTCIRGLW